MGPTTSDLQPLVRRLTQLGLCDPDAQAAVLRCVSGVRRAPAGHAFISAGDSPSDVCVLLDGFAARSKLLAQGERQILSFRIPGDFCEAQALASPVLDFDVVAITACRLAVLPRQALAALTGEHPQLALALWREAVAGAAVEREWIVNLGRRNAAERLAHMLCEVEARMRGAGLANEGRFPFPLTQRDMADALGLSVVHVNRSLQRLRGLGLIDARHGTVEVRDAQGLADLAGFEASYLDLDQHAAPLQARGPGHIRHAPSAMA